MHSEVAMSEQFTFIEQQISENIAFFTRRRDFNRKAAFRFTIVPAALAAFATVAIGTEEKLHLQWLPIVAMLATGIASVLGAWQSLFANRQLWRVNNTTLAGLYELRLDMEYRRSDKTSVITKTEIDDYLKRLKTIIGTAEEALQRAYST
jgi:hypothetical protein